PESLATGDVWNIGVGSEIGIAVAHAFDHRKNAAGSFHIYDCALAMLPCHVRCPLTAEQQTIAPDLLEAHSDGKSLVGIGIVGKKRRILDESRLARPQQELTRPRILESGGEHRWRHRQLSGDPDLSARRVSGVRTRAERIAAKLTADRYRVPSRLAQAVFIVRVDLDSGRLCEYYRGEKGQHFLMPRWVRDVVDEPDLPEYEIGLAAPNVQCDRSIRIVDDVAFLEICRRTTVVVFGSEIEGAERPAEGDEKSSAEHTGARPVAVVGVAGVLNGLIVRGNAGLRPEIHRGERCAGVWPEPAVGDLQLQSERSESEPIVGVEVESDASVSDKTGLEVLVSVLHPAAIGANAEPAFGIDLEQACDVEPVSGRNVVGELSLRL